MTTPATEAEDTVFDLLVGLGVPGSLAGMAEERILEVARAQAAAAAPVPVPDGLREALEYAAGFMADPEGLAHRREEWLAKVNAALATAQPSTNPNDARTSSLL